MDQIFTLFIADDHHMKVFLCFRINIFFNCRDHQSGHRCLIFLGPIFAGDDRIRSEYFGGCESWPDVQARLKTVRSPHPPSISITDTHLLGLLDV